MSGFSNIVIMLLNRGANIDHAGSLGNTSLLWSIEGGHEGLVEMLLNRGASANPYNSNRSIIKAVRKGFTNVVSMLLDRGIDVEAKDECNDNTILMLTARLGYISIVEMLLNRGANTRHVNNNNQSLLELAVQSECKELVEKFLKANIGNSVDILNRSLLLIDNPTDVRSGIEMVEMLLNAGANIECRKSLGGNTPLMNAVWNARVLDLIKMLLERGANVNSVNYLGQTSLMCVTFDCASVVELLLDRGADINHEDNEGNTPLIIAASRNYLDVMNTLINTLINRGADIMHTNNKGQTGLTLARKNKCKDTPKRLKELIDAKSKKEDCSRKRKRINQTSRFMSSNDN